MPLIRIQPTGADEFGGPVNRALEDESGSWWAGAMQCGARIAISVALATNALGAQLAAQTQLQEQHERIPPPPSYVDDAQGFLPAATTGLAITYPAPWAGEQHEDADDLYVAQDELPAPVVVIPWPQPIIPRQWEFEQHEQATALYAPQDELPAPVYTPPWNANVLPPQWAFEQHEDGADLYVVQDEDPAPITVTPVVQPVVPQPFAWDQHESIAQAATVVDDGSDAWSSWTPAVPPLSPVAALAQLPPAWGFTADEVNSIEDWAHYAPPTPAAVAPAVPQPWAFDQGEQAAILYAVQDEDPAPVIVVPLLPYVVPSQASFDQHELATGLYAPQDELPAPVTVIPPTLTVLPAQWEFEQHENAAALYAVQDEDPAPVVVTPWPAPIVPAAWIFEQHENAAALYAVQDENPQPVDVRQPIAPVVPSPFAWDQGDSAATQVTPDDSGVVAPIAQPAAVAAPVFQPWAFAQDELPNIPDDDPGVVPIAPNVAPSAALPLWGHEQHEPATGLYVAQDELPAPVYVPGWAAAVVPATWSFEQNEAPPRIADDSADFWILSILPSPVAPGAAPISASAIDENPPAGLHGQPDEDFWLNAVAPVPAALTYPQPFAFEQHEIAGIVLYPDEDYWTNSAAPVVASLAWPQPFVFEQHEQARNLYAPQDEDPAPVVFPPWASTVLPAQWAFDQQEAPPQIADDSGDVWTPRGLPLPPIVAPFTTDGDTPGGLHGEPDEDFWTNPVAAVPASLTPPAPWGFEQHEIAGIILYPDEDCWQNGVVPVPATFVVPQPSSFEQHERGTGLYVVQDENPAPVQLTPWPTTIVPAQWQFEQNEIVAAPADDDAAPLRVIYPQGIVVTPFTADDDLPAQRVVDDDSGYQPTILPAIAGAPILAWGSDSHEAAPRIASQTDDEWSVILRPWPEPIVAQQWTFDQPERPYLAVDDDAATNGAGLALGVATQSAAQIAGIVAAQPIADAEDVPTLYGQPDEDFWINAVAPLDQTFIVPAQHGWEMHERFVPPNVSVAGPRRTFAALAPHVARVTLGAHVTAVTFDTFHRTVALTQPIATVVLTSAARTATLTTVTRTVELKD